MSYLSNLNKAYADTKPFMSLHPEQVPLKHGKLINQQFFCILFLKIHNDGVSIINDRFNELLRTRNARDKILNHLSPFPTVIKCSEIIIFQFLELYLNKKKSIPRGAGLEYPDLLLSPPSLLHYCDPVNSEHITI